MNITTKNRKTGSMISLFNEGGLWTVNCDSHDQCCEFETLRTARSFQAMPNEFCSDCYAIVKASNNGQVNA